jgi:transposase InsO family protein
MALMMRKPEPVIHHCDQASQCTSIAFGNRCKEMGVRPSMGAVGDGYDNAMAESFFAGLQCEFIARRSWRTKTEASLAVFYLDRELVQPVQATFRIELPVAQYIRKEAAGKNHQHRKPDNPRASMKKLKLSVETGQVQLHFAK